MYVPRTWARDTRSATLRDGRTVPVSAWGWGDDQISAQAMASERLRRALDRIHRHKPLPHSYEYEGLPLHDSAVPRNAFVRVSHPSHGGLASADRLGTILVWSVTTNTRSQPGCATMSRPPHALPPAATSRPSAMAGPAGTLGDYRNCTTG